MPAGYYTLAEAAALISKSGTPVIAESTVAGDIYAMRIENADWKELRPALEADGRLTFVQRDGVWRIGRTSNSFNAENAALKRYLAAAAKSIHKVYGAAEKRIRDLQSLPEAERSKAAVDALDDVSKDPVEKRIKQLVYLYTGNELPFGIVAAASAFTSPAQPPRFGQTVFTTAFENPGLLLPNGNIRYLKLPGGGPLTDAETVELARNTSISLKLVLDPLTLSTGAKYMAVGSLGTKGMFFSGRNEEISPPLAIKIEPSEVWTREELADLNRRFAITEESLKPSRYSEDSGFKEPLLSSEALLKSAERFDANLVSYVAPFSDVVQSGIANFREVIAGKKVDLAWVLRTLAERADGVYVRDLKLPVSTTTRYTAEFSGPILVVRDEMRFLSGLCSSPAGPSTSLLNGHFRGKAPNLGELVEAIAILDFKRWPNSFFSSTYLTFCNPVSFRPFALLLQKSPVLRKKIAELEPGKPVTIPYSELEMAATSSLHSAILESVPHCDAGTVWGNPAMVAQLLAPRQGQDPKIRLERKQAQVEFRMIHDDETKWRSWVDNVDYSIK